MEASDRYADLFSAAVLALVEDARRPGVKAVDAQPALFAYPLRMARERMPLDRRVGRPRHLVVFRIGEGGVIDVLGLVHDRMILSRAAKRMQRRALFDSDE
ncbi:hypothetical protein J4558_25465 [Leptolyngbya sp. 15MV]|nr:hypothetical protein J4558_25465 [Leptolyngbya sp. 15MV]